MGLPEVLDQHYPSPLDATGLSWGWTAVIGLRLSSLWRPPESVGGNFHQGMHHTLRHLTAPVIEPLI
jgi:hypothetical protein